METSTKVWIGLGAAAAAATVLGLYEHIKGQAQSIPSNVVIKSGNGGSNYSWSFQEGDAIASVTSADTAVATVTTSASSASRPTFTIVPVAAGFTTVSVSWFDKSGATHTNVINVQVS